MAAAAAATTTKQSDDGPVPRFGIRLADGYVNDNHGKGWPTREAADDQLSVWFFGGDSFGAAMSHHFSGAVVVEIDAIPNEAVQ